jgi:DNA-binding CsgD family transcriptional regulator
MGAVEHLKTLCCLGLPPESAMIALTPVLHEIIPHSWSRWGLLDSKAARRSTWAENPAAAPLYRERLWRFLDSSSGMGRLYLSAFKAGSIGWALPLQGREWFHSSWYREIEAPLDVCWMLDAMISVDGRTVGLVALTRPRIARRFTTEDVQCLDRLRPWLGHALRQDTSNSGRLGSNAPISVAGAPVRSGELIATPNGKPVFQAAGTESLLKILAGESGDYTRQAPTRDALPSPVQVLVRRIVGAANGSGGNPPSMHLSTAHGVVTLEAKWLVPEGAFPQDVARDPKSCLVSVTLDLHEHPIAHAARVLRESGVTPMQLKVALQLALGKSKPAIARELGVQPSSVAEHTKELYQRLDVHSAAELGFKLWTSRPALQRSCD